MKVDLADSFVEYCTRCLTTGEKMTTSEILTTRVLAMHLTTEVQTFHVINYKCYTVGSNEPMLTTSQCTKLELTPG